jgi:hypothetical protein
MVNYASHGLIAHGEFGPQTMWTPAVSIPISARVANRSGPLDRARP